MSQLYQYFCDGLRNRSSTLLSSTFITSTPLEEDDGEAGPGPCPDPGPAASPSIAKLLQRNNSQSQSDHEELEKDKGTESSVQGQVGSATESPPADDQVDGMRSPVPAVMSMGLQRLQATPEVVPSQKQQVEDGSENLLNASQHSRHARERNDDVSSVDFVDRIIAAKRRDDARKPKRPARCSTSTDESQPQHDEPVIKSRKVNDCGNDSDSSETDYEGASEYYRSRQTQNSTCQPNSSGQNKNLPKKSSLSGNEESNMQLVLECISSENSSPYCSLNRSQNLEDGSVLLPSAARCRVYIRFKDGKGKSSDCQPDPLPQNDHQGIETRTAKVVLTDILNTQQAGIATADTNISKSTAVLNGVTAYVEVRSGHDNRSMGVRTQLRNLGARVLDKLSTEVTHVVFNEGAPSTLRKAQKQGCHLVSVLWIDECKKHGRIAPEADHPPLDLHLYDEPGAYRKMKSFQPDFEEGKAEERQKKQLKRLKARSQKATSSQPSSQSAPSEEESSDDVSEETQPNPNIPDGVALKTLSIVLKRIDAIDSCGVSTQKKNKRKLLPLKQRLPASLSFDDFPADRVRPPFPYSQSSSSQKKKNIPPRRIVKYQSSSSQNFRRRSSCFVRGTPGLSGSKQKKVKAKIPTMVCTFMHRREIDVVAAVIKQLGGWILEPTVSSRTTHVVCGESKRTINLLRGIAHGCWIIRQEWVLRSLEAGYWLDEEPFELTEFPAVQQSRIARETLGAAPDIFSSAGCIYVSKDSTPPYSELTDLLELCGGNLVKSVRQARVIIGPYQRRPSHTDVMHVKEQWVLDSIQENMLQPTRNYRL
ncbi:uncharacterized protein LOC117653955 isoform X2 [Thrips palmi]|uniref:Uncharacterized protein LOC117653955 isoform X2 n=1 Tax=Thrips palmi TaxID=161013 RepID=A0A6P9ACJ4_THRPL|nr:uncharacterized protein LOC117653955 isoform X2 [Thrips palmi]